MGKRYGALAGVKRQKSVINARESRDDKRRIAILQKKAQTAFTARLQASCAPRQLSAVAPLAALAL
jgi:hypothetical protein